MLTGKKSKKAIDPYGAPESTVGDPIKSTSAGDLCDPAWDESCGSIAQTSSRLAIQKAPNSRAFLSLAKNDPESSFNYKPHQLRSENLFRFRGHCDYCNKKIFTGKGKQLTLLFLFSAE